jgi:hypothetical protein
MSWPFFGVSPFPTCPTLAGVAEKASRQCGCGCYRRGKLQEKNRDKPAQGGVGGKSGFNWLILALIQAGSCSSEYVVCAVREDKARSTVITATMATAAALLF